MFGEIVWCPRCKRTLPISAFSPSQVKNGRGWCRSCHNEHRWRKRDGISHPRLTDVCLFCGVDISTLRTHAKYCSSRCSMNSFRRRNPGRRREALLLAHGISVEQFSMLFEKQNRRCAACGSTTPRSWSTWQVDHCHMTGSVRGILCGRCNTGIGLFQDSSHILRNATSYLLKPMTPQSSSMGGPDPVEVTIDNDLFLCTRCKQHLPAKRFSPSQLTLAGRWCQPCHNAYRRMRRSGTDPSCASRVCLHCKRSITDRRTNAKYCSRRCGMAVFHKNNPEYNRYSQIKALYGITADEYTRLFNGQSGVCAICGTKGRKNRYLDIDHCHASSEVRGLLCSSCNMGLGLFEDNVDAMKLAVRYLERVSATY
jgi:hypothetical protein